MDLTHRIQRSFKPRFAIIYPFGIFALIFGSVTDVSLRTGIGYVIAGLLIRLWSNGYAIKNEKLTTSGPYAYVRNPLYLGTFLIAIGLAIILQFGITVSCLFLAALLFVYSSTIKGEENMLVKKFGKNYEDYRSKVLSFIPRLTPYAEGEKWPFSMDRLIFSKEYKSFVWITIIIIAFHLKTRLLLEHKPMIERTWGLILLIAILIMLDIFYEMNKKKTKR